MKLWTAAFAVVLTSGSALAQPQVIPVNPAVTSGDIDEFAISPDGTKIAFVGQLEGDSSDQVYVMDIAGGNATKLNPASAGDVDGGVAWTPDGTGVVARYGGGDGNIDNQVYVLPADGSLAATQVTFNDFNVFDYQISADGSTLFYVDARNDPDEDGDDLLYAISLTNPGSDNVLLTPDQFAEIDSGSYAQTGSDIIYAGSLPGEGESRFYRVAQDGSNALTPTEITITNAPIDFTYDIDEMAVTPDGQNIVFVADLTTDGVDELYIMDAAGGEATQLIDGIEGFADVNPFVISEDGEYIAFTGDLGINGDSEVWVMALGDPSSLTQLSNLGDLPYNADAGAGVGRIQFSADGSQIYFLADGRENGVNEIFVVDNVLIPAPATSVLVAAAGLVSTRRRRV